jgi:hypothetical protein
MAGLQRKIGVTSAALAMVVAAVLVTAGPAAAKGKPPKPTITGLAASPSVVSSADGTVVLSATVTNATTCLVTAKPGVSTLPASSDCSSGTFSQSLVLPATKTKATYTFTLSAAGSSSSKSAKVKVTVDAGDGQPLLAGAKSMIGDDGGFCSVLSSGGVDCWGDTLGNGTENESATPVQVVGINGVGTLSGVKSLASMQFSFCAVLNSGGVDCWGEDTFGELGNGTVGTTSYVPVQVENIEGNGPLTGVSSLDGGGSPGSYCAVLTTGEVDCWGNGTDGDLGDGSTSDSDIPVQVVNTSDDGPLTGVVSVVRNGGPSYDASGFCAVLTSGNVDCWGDTGGWGDGNGGVPVEVGGGLDDVVSLVSDNGGYCAVLASEGVDCWGPDVGDVGVLGDGTVGGSLDPVAVEGLGGVGTTLGDVKSLVTDSGYSENGFCALLTTGLVDCWGGGGVYGSLGDGPAEPQQSAVPVQVEGVTDAKSIQGAELGYCVVVSSGGSDCWGFDVYGELGNGIFLPFGSSTPSAVKGVGGVGSLKNVESLASTGVSVGPSTKFCALISPAGAVDCWGFGSGGDSESSATPVQVLAP